MRLPPIIEILRPHQWLKNLLLFFPPFLGGKLFLPGMWQKGLLPFLSFSLAASATYVINDLRDCEGDRNHPRKKERPLANGVISERFAIIIAVVLLIGALVAGAFVSLPFLGWLGAYFALSSAYSFGLKNQPIFDIFCIAFGFVFRIFAGGMVFHVKVSDWLFLSVVLLSLFLSCGKRLSEQHLLGPDSADHRKSLGGYPEGVLEAFMYISGAAVLVTYTLYVITMRRLIYTVPLCCFGLFRYILIVQRGESGDPTDSLMKDPVLFLTGLVWVGMVAFSIYFKNW
jgi:4-hydroxybenzoate polyprenyltransferase